MEYGNGGKHNMTGIFYVFIIMAVVLSFIIIPWYINGVASDTGVSTAIQKLAMPQYQRIDAGLGGAAGTVVSFITTPISVISFVVGYFVYVNTLINMDVPGMVGWLSWIWYLIIGLFAAAMLYIIYSILAARSG